MDSRVADVCRLILSSQAPKTYENSVVVLPLCSIHARQRRRICTRQAADLKERIGKTEHCSAACLSDGIPGS
jgi:hypothetical protein